MDQVTRDELAMQALDTLHRIEENTRAMAREMSVLRRVRIGANAEEERELLLKRLLAEA